MVQWLNTYLACTRPWVHSLGVQKKKVFEPLLDKGNSGQINGKAEKAGLIEFPVLDDQMHIWPLPKYFQ